MLLLDFEENCYLGWAFLSFYALYIRFVPDQFSSDQDKILCVLEFFFFKSDCVTKWSEKVFYQESTTDSFSIFSKTEFEKLFHVYLFSINTEIKVVSKLEESAYYQRSCVVEDYLDEFQILIFETG